MSAPQPRDAGSRATPLLAAAIFLGILLPDVAAFVRPAFEPTVVVMLAAALIRLDWRVMAGHAARGRRLAAVAGWQLLLAPALVFAAVTALGAPPVLVYAMTLAAAAPPVASSPVFARLVRLDPPLSVVATVSTTLLLPAGLVLVDATLPGVRLALSAEAFLIRAALFIGLPFALALAVRRLVPPAALTRAAPGLDALTYATMMLFGLGIMDGVGPRLLAEPGLVLSWLAIAFALNIGLQVAAALVFALPRGGRPDAAALTLALCSGNRNMGLMWGVTGGAAGAAYLGPTAGADVFLFVGLSQIPIFVLPLVLRPLYRRLAPAAAG